METTGEKMETTEQTETLGKLISSQQGWCGGPQYGEVYTAPAGGAGYIAGYRTSAAEGLGVIARKWFAKKKDAMSYALKSTQGR